MILPKAKVSLPLRIHKMLFTFSGNSVAIGIINKDNNNAEIPMICAAASTPLMKPLAPAINKATPKTNWTTITIMLLGKPNLHKNISPPASVACPSSTSAFEAFSVIIT